MDEVTYAVNLLDAGWPDSTERNTLGIPTLHSVKPTIIEVEDMT